MANKFYNYMMFMSGTLLLFYFLGLIEQGVTGTLMALLLDPASLSGSAWFGIVFGTVASVLATAIAVKVLGFRADIVIFSVLIAPLLGFGWDFLSIFSVVAESSRVFAILVLSPFMLLWVLTVMEWWRGVTN